MALEQLRCLRLDGCELLTVAGIACLAHLQGLSLNEERDVTDAGVGMFRHFKQLRNLRLANFMSIISTALAHPGSLTALESFSECGCVTDAALPPLQSLVRLQHLSLCECRQVTDAGLAHLASLMAQQSLSRMCDWPT